MTQLLTILAIGLGGAAGALARYGVGELVKRYWEGSWPLSTTIVNLLGCLLIGFLSVSLTDKVALPVRMGILTGLLGALTTFSTFCIEGHTLLMTEDARVRWLGLAYLLSQVVIGVLLVALGIFLARTLFSGSLTDA